MYQKKTADDDLNSFVKLQLVSYEFICSTYAHKLAWAVAYALIRFPKKKWDQKAIHAATGIRVRRLQDFRHGKCLPTQEEANKLADVLDFPPLSHLPSRFETIEGLNVRLEHDDSCVETFVAHRDAGKNSRLKKEIMRIAARHKQATSWEEQKLCDQEVHHLMLRYHSNPEILRWLYELMGRRIDYFAYNAPYLNIWQFKNRVEWHKDAHDDLIKMYLTGTVKQIKDSVYKHYEFMIKCAKILEEFFKKNPDPESWGTQILNKEDLGGGVSIYFI